MIAMESFIRTKDFSAISADELFFINGGSGANAGVSYTSVGGVPVAISGNQGTITFTSSGNSSNSHNCQVAIADNHGTVTVSVNSGSGGSSGGGGK